MGPALFAFLLLVALLATPLTVWLVVREHRAHLDKFLEHLRETKTVGGDTQDTAAKKLEIEDRKLTLEEKRLDLEGQIRTARAVDARNRTLTAAQVLGG